MEFGFFLLSLSLSPRIFTLSSGGVEAKKKPDPKLWQVGWLARLQAAIGVQIHAHKRTHNSLAEESKEEGERQRQRGRGRANGIL